MIIGYSFFGNASFDNNTAPITSIDYMEIKNAIFDEIEIREKTDVDTSSTKQLWDSDFRALFRFMSDLEGGNINNNGLKIAKFELRRRRSDETSSIKLAELDYIQDYQYSYKDYTQPNDELVYSIVPIAENELRGKPSDLEVESDFTGWWIVDKDTNNVLGFNTFLNDSEPDVEVVLNRGRTEIETFSKYPTVFYDERKYNKFTLEAIIVPSDYSRSGKDYEKIISHFINDPKPFLVKSSGGQLFIVDISSIKMSSPLNTWKGRDYGKITMEFTEVMDYEDYMAD